MPKAGELTNAWRLFRKGDPDAAADVLEPLVEREPQEVPARLLLARCYSRMRLGEDAVAEIEEALELAPDNAEAHALRGAEHYFADEFEEAAEELNRAIELDPSCVEAYVRLAQVRVDEKEFGEAASLLETAEERAGDDKEKLALVRMGQVYLAMQQRQNSRVLELISENEELLAANPYAAATVRSNQAVVYARQRDYARARELLIEVLDLDPYFHTARGLLGQIAALQRDYELAVDQLQQVVEHSGEVGAHVYYSLATSLAALGRRAEASQYYGMALGEGLTGFPGLSARLALLLPNPRARLAVGAVLLAVVAVLAFRFLSPFMAAALVFGLGLLGWQMARGGR